MASFQQVKQSILLQVPVKEPTYLILSKNRFLLEVVFLEVAYELAKVLRVLT
jgi:hypothetical protein